MAEIDGKLLEALLQNLQRDMNILKDGQREIRQELLAIRGHVTAIQSDISNLYAGQAKTELQIEQLAKAVGMSQEPAE
ncbi:MAG: hypothetical protein AAFO61_01730 [Pseudomonadota bacterium]